MLAIEMNKPCFIRSFELAARRRRFDLFRDLLTSLPRSGRQLTILDLGGTYEYWRSVDWKTLGSIDVILLNITPEREVPPPFHAVTYNGHDLSRYLDQQFDCVYSNSVLGHVGSFQNQIRFASEIRRLGRSYVVQTPNRYFPIDWRTLIPGFHLLPVSWQAWFLRHVAVGIYPRIGDYAESLLLASRVRNLTSNELKILFPGATIVRERVGGFTKSFVVHSGFKCTKRDACKTLL